jgi:hypothetical protein
MNDSQDRILESGVDLHESNEAPRIHMPISNQYFNFNKNRNAKERAIWWLEHPEALLWGPQHVSKIHRFPGPAIPLDKSNIYK